jgi:hypothetical protein
MDGFYLKVYEIWYTRNGVCLSHQKRIHSMEGTHQRGKSVGDSQTQAAPERVVCWSAKFVVCLTKA